MHVFVIIFSRAAAKVEMYFHIHLKYGAELKSYFIVEGKLKCLECLDGVRWINKTIFGVISAEVKNLRVNGTD